MARLHRGSGNHAVPEALDPIDEGAGARRVLARALADESRLEALQQLALLRGEVHRRLHHRLAVQVAGCAAAHRLDRSEEHTSELQSLMRISYAVFCLKKKNHKNTHLVQRCELVT